MPQHFDHKMLWQKWAIFEYSDRLLGIAEGRKERKPRSHEAVLIGAASRKIRQLLQGGEKNAKTIVTAATEAAEKIAKTKLGLTELPAEIKQKLDERVKAAGKK
jgi:hypothetical protein